METFDAIRNRRSIRKFRTEPVPDDCIARCLEAGRLAPSATNSQPWKFLVVRDPAKRAALMDAAYGQKMVGQAPVVIVLLGDTKAYGKRFRRGKELLDVGAIDQEMADTLARVYGSRKDTDGGVGKIMINCMLAGEHIILQATSEGLGSCWVMLFDRERAVFSLELPAHLFPVALLPIGYADQEPGPRPRYALGEIAFDESVDRPWQTDPNV